MKLPRRRFLQLTAGTAALHALTQIAEADDYPSRPIRLIVGFTPGTAPDIATRTLANDAEDVARRRGEELSRSKSINVSDCWYLDEYCRIEYR